MKDGRTVLGAENDMNEDIGQRLRPAEEDKPACSPVKIAWLPKTQADGLGWYDHATLAATIGHRGGRRYAQ